MQELWERCGLGLDVIRKRYVSMMDFVNHLVGSVDPDVLGKYAAVLWFV